MLIDKRYVYIKLQISCETETTVRTGDTESETLDTFR